MSYTKTYTLDNTPSGDTVNNAIVNKLDKNADQIVADLNTHEALTTNAHGFTGTKTGSGAMVGATSPTLVTPTIGVATATSINKVAITAPATSATITVADGKTLTVSGDITIPTIATGGILYGSATGVLSALAKGTAYQVLQMNSGATAPEWTSTPSLGGISLTGTTTNSGTISGGTVNATTLKQGGVQAVTTTGEQTLTNKTLTAPSISDPTFTSGPGAYYFFAYYGADAVNVTGDGTEYTFVGSSERYDTAGHSSGTVTIPETGIYRFNTFWNLYGMSASHTPVVITFLHTGATTVTYPIIVNTAGASATYCGVSACVDIYCTAGTTVGVSLTISGSTKTIYVKAGSSFRGATSFSGTLLMN